MASEEKHAPVILDEIALKPGLEYDTTISEVIGRPTIPLSGNRDSSNELTTHALVFMLAGITSRWKQVIAYEFTGNSYSGEAIYHLLLGIIHAAHDIGITIKCFMSDMGSQNQAVWRLMNITATRHGKIQNFIEHPINSTEKLYSMPDSVHILKNIAGALRKGHKFVLDPKIVKKYNLPYNEVSINPIRDVFVLDQQNQLQLAPRLKEQVLQPSHFETMNVALSVALLNNDVSCAITYYISKQKIDGKHETTAWFLKTIFKWFYIMSARDETMALSHFKEEVFKDTVEFLNNVIEIFVNIKVRMVNKEKATVSWKPFQSGVLLATQTALNLQEEYLERNGFYFLMLGRLTQDVLENLFSLARSRQPISNCREFKTAIRLITLSQFESDVRKGSYSVSDNHFLVQYCKELDKENDLKKHTVDENIEEQLYQEIMSNSIPIGDCLGEQEKEQLSDEEQNSLYYLIGLVLNKFRSFSTCSACYNSVCTTREDENIADIAIFTKLKEYKKNLLEFPSLVLYTYMYKAELFFRKYSSNILINKLKLIDLSAMFISEYGLESFPKCHEIAEKMLKMFFKCRIYFLLRYITEQEKQTNIKFLRNQASSSKSLSMRVAMNFMPQ